MNKNRRFLSFTIIWLGQVASLLGTSMTTFGFTIWAYQETGEATTLALVNFFFFSSQIIVAIFAGSYVDRFDKKSVMIFSDAVSGLTTIVILVLYAFGGLQIWHIYLNAVVVGAFQNTQWLSYSAILTVTVPKSMYSRANGMVSIAETSSGIFAPIFAAVAYAQIGLNGILLIDIVSFVFAISLLLLVNIPPTPTGEGEGDLLKDVKIGIKYIWDRPLAGLLLIFLLNNFWAMLPIAIVSALMLTRTGNSEIALGGFQTAGAIGGVLGGLLMTAWGGGKRKIHSILLGSAARGFFDLFILGVFRTYPLWLFSRFTGAFTLPIVNASSQSLWQLKVDPSVQGRVFSVRRFLAFAAMPIATLIAGPLSDNFLEPQMMPDGYLAPIFGWLVGTGPGAGMALLCSVTGFLSIITSLCGYLFPSIRNIETILPDYGGVTDEKLEYEAPAY